MTSLYEEQNNAEYEKTIFNNQTRQEEICKEIKEKFHGNPIVLAAIEETEPKNEIERVHAYFSYLYRKYMFPDMGPEAINSDSWEKETYDYAYHVMKETVSQQGIPEDNFDTIGLTEEIMDLFYESQSLCDEACGIDDLSPEINSSSDEYDMRCTGIKKAQKGTIILDTLEALGHKEFLGGKKENVLAESLATPQPQADTFGAR